MTEVVLCSVLFVLECWVKIKMIDDMSHKVVGLPNEKRKRNGCVLYYLIES